MVMAGRMPSAFLITVQNAVGILVFAGNHT
jgi:hypothetical protein